MRYSVERDKQRPKGRLQCHWRIIGNISTGFTAQATWSHCLAPEGKRAGERRVDGPWLSMKQGRRAGRTGLCYKAVYGPKRAMCQPRRCFILLQWRVKVQLQKWQVKGVYSTHWTDLEILLYMCRPKRTDQDILQELACAGKQRTVFGAQWDMTTSLFMHEQRGAHVPLFIRSWPRCIVSPIPTRLQQKRFALLRMAQDSVPLGTTCACHI